MDKKTVLSFFVVFLLLLQSEANTVKDTLYINQGEIEMIDGLHYPFKAFNTTEQFEANNSVFEIEPDDTLNLTIINHDVTDHFISIQSKLNQQNVAAGDTINLSIQFHDAGIYQLYDSGNDKEQYSLGLGTMIIVKDDTHKRFYWNLKDFDTTIHHYSLLPDLYNFEAYAPQYFLINENSHPNINKDSNARIVGNVGDTLMLYIANSGNSIHSIHFHGYHAEIIDATNSKLIGWSKDTFPIKPRENLVLRIVPDKPGIYPVHDHNLVAIAANGIYPNGMFSTIQIQ